MCYQAGISCINGHELEIRIRRLAALVTAVNQAEMTVARQQAVVDGGEEARRTKKQCLCSPTLHPGSFREMMYFDPKQVSDHIWSPGPGHCDPFCDCEEAPLLPKLRGYFAELFRESCLAPLGILYLPTCVGFGYMYIFVEGCLSFSWEYGMGYFIAIAPGTQTLARGIFLTPSYPEKGHLTSLNR
ncbi:hypothetical protein E3N88_21351 [Mikania micrantha]|uniref:Uncharacterized protein n=1 Tax=Mikania micrantha TaxID=192012 RepID=A0A5N6NMD5_9ASTR|nr:hypothetical protein E3N88_21351 [Mikania micrantha]